jgi:cell division septation protein DedD
LRLPHSSATDDGFHEIQLNGKQLVFLFMAATVVSVVIFLCGVLVGRGVKPVSLESLGVAAPESVTADVPASAPSLPASPATQPAASELPPTPGELTYYDRLEKNTPPAETLKLTPEAPKSPAAQPEPVPAAVERASSPAAQKPASPAGERRSPVPTPNSPQTPTALGAPGEPAGSGYAVQVAALRAQREADAIAKRLTGKGYPAYVMSPSAGAPASVYRVRVGKFRNRREAEQVAARLEKEEQFKPWVVR